MRNPRVLPAGDDLTLLLERERHSALHIEHASDLLITFARMGDDSDVIFLSK
jgi:hypothetical protein